jgi:hypothetical protein
MKIKLNTSKIILVACISILFNLSHKTLKAQRGQIAPLINKEGQKGTDSATLSYIVKYKIKAITILSYNSQDSTLNNAKLASKSKSIYDREGNLVETVSENARAKIIDKSISKYDSKNNLTHYTLYDSTNKMISSEKSYYDNLNRLIELITYDSANKVSYSWKVSYDNLNRIIETSSTYPLSFYTGKTDDNKITSSVNRYKYDVNGNLIESTTDSSGINVYKDLSMYDDKNQLLYIKSFDHNRLQSVKTYTDDKKGGYTETIEYYWNAIKKSMFS